MTEPTNPNAPKAASEQTRKLHAHESTLLCFDDVGDLERAQRGLIATHPTGRIDLAGNPVWDTARHDFVREREDAPQEVHPGLWRQARLNAIHGLFEVTEGVWQARGYDLSNITFIAGERGWVIIDPLTTQSTAAACLQLANDKLGERPVTAVIYTHSHIDHYGGAYGVTTPEAAAAGDVRIIAPVGFLHEVVSENVIAGPAMARRATYQFGILLPPDPRGHVDCGLGKAVPFGGSGLIAPTEEVTTTGTELTVDGVRIIFQNTPGAEAPAEMNFFFPDKQLLCMAENCTHNLHNLYPLRGAQVRDSLAWSKYIGEAQLLFGADSETMFSTHHWPRFGKQDVAGFLELQRDAYRWLHDQTMRLANRGMTGAEIAEVLERPDVFASQSHVQGYYGTVSHNIKSIYQRYLGWYDGNPATLNPLPRTAAGARYVEFMGGADAVLKRARESFEAGDYRWVAEIVNHVVFADPQNTEARALQADALEQLGYQAESGTWRNAYLTGAQELRNGSLLMALGAGHRHLDQMTAEQIFDALGVRFDPVTFGDGRGRIAMHFTDLDEHHVLGIGNAAVYQLPHVQIDDAETSVRLDRAALGRLMSFSSTLDAEVDAGHVTVGGDRALLSRLIDALDRQDQGFALIEPTPAG